MARFIITAESGHDWLVVARSADAARRAWDRAVTAGDAEPALSEPRRLDLRRREDRESAEYLREQGQADVDA